MKKKDFLNLWLHFKHRRLVFEHGEKKRFGWIKWILILGVVAFIALGAFLFLVILPSLPDINNIQNLVAAQASTIYDKEGNVLYTIHGEENRKVIPLAEISQFATSAILAIEDDEFYQHGGVDFGAILKAVCSELGLCKQRGGSTITQQFVKNAFLSSDRTYERKLKEIILALQLEGQFGKDEILGMYLNRISYGAVHGIERAANAFFGKSAAELTVAEAAILAAIPKAPSTYSPYGDYKHASIDLDEEEIIKMNIDSEQELVDINPNFIIKGLLGKTYKFGACGQEDEPSDD
ncbi:transglycosylase domain-containing protein, partial [candidate division KSB1 bacterium]